MGIKSISAIIYIILFLICSPAPRDISFTIENNTQHDFKVNTFWRNSEVNNYDMLELSSVEFYKVRIRHAGFGNISSLDSIIIVDVTNTKKQKWVRPNNTYGFIDTDKNYGEEREVPKDMYNKKNWTLEMFGDDQEWTFTINDSDLGLFE
jgi:elongation factor P--beta-lysine ligase